MWESLWASMPSMGGWFGGGGMMAGTPTPLPVTDQQQLLNMQPPGAMGPVDPNLGLVPDAMPKNGAGFFDMGQKRAAPGQAFGQAGGGMAQMLQGARGLMQQGQAPAAAAPPPMPAMQQLRPLQQVAAPPPMMPGNPYLEQAPMARRALQLQRGLLDG